MQYTPQEISYIDRAMQSPLEFNVSEANIKNVWGRAQSFIGQYSELKLQIVTDYVIQTYSPKEHEIEYGYSIVKKPTQDGYQVVVECSCGNPYCTKEVLQNAHIVAYYIKTGIEPPTPSRILNR
jgi:hypothetical protein